MSVQATPPQLGGRGSLRTSSRLVGTPQLLRCHTSRAGSGTGAVAAAALCAATQASPSAAGGPAQLSSNDPALDSLIDRWLSHKHASTSAPGQNGSSGGGSSSRREQRQQQGEPASQQDWESLLGPVSVTLASLATLDEGDELFALTDSLGHLGGSLQELQQLAPQLVEQQQDSAAGPSSLAAADAEQYRQQLSQLLTTAAQQAAALDDAGLVDLLATATVTLTATKRSTAASSSTQAPVAAAATAAVQAACAELWLRPGVARGLGAAQLTSLAVVLRRLSKLSLSSSGLPVSLPLSAYRQLQQLAEAGQLSGPQLAVCCWCLSSLPVAPPSQAVAAALHAAALTASSVAGGSSSGSSGLDGLATRRLLAACANWQPYLAARLSSDSRGAFNAAAAAAEWIQSAAQACCLQLSSSDSPAGSSSGSSSSSADGVWKVAASVAQSAAAYGVFPGEDFVGVVAAKLLQQQGESAGAAGDQSPAGRREAEDVAAAAGYLVPWWGCLPANQQPTQAVLQLHAKQQEQEQQQQPALLHTFLAAVEHGCSAAVGAEEQQQLHLQLDAVAGQLVGSSQQPLLSGATLSLLLRGMTACSCHSEQLLPLCTAAAAALQGNTRDAAAEVAAVDASAALCRLQPPGWQPLLQQLGAMLLHPDSSALQQLQLKPALQLHAAAAAAAGSSPAAAELAAAVLQQLLQPSVLVGASAADAADLLLRLTVGTAPWHITSGQQLTPAPPAGLVQAGSSSGNGSKGRPSSPVVLLQQQCLRCLGVLVKDGGRSLLPSQLVPLLAALRFLQQTQQQQQQQQADQQQWFGVMPGQLLSACRQLHREALAAVTLQLQDCASLLVPVDLAWSARLLALLQARPSLALAAVVQAAVRLLGHMAQQDLVWMLWGLTKLQCSVERRMQQRLLAAALQGALAAALEEPGAAGSAAQVQQQEPGGKGPPAAAAECAGSSSGGSDGSSVVLLDSGVVLLWVAASRACKDPATVQLLAQLTQQATAPYRPAQVASLVWSFTRLARLSLPHQQQLLQRRGTVLQLAERSLGSSAAGQELTARQTAVLAWGLHRLGHQPSSSAAAALTTAALQHTRPGLSADDAAGFLPGEFSCILFCLASWGVRLQQQELQQLEQYLQQQLSQDLQAAAAAAEAAPGSPSGPAAASDGTGSSGLRWDGPAVCSACSSLAQLGATLQHSTLAAAEQYLLRLLPDTPNTPAQLAAATSDGSAVQQPQQQRRQRHLPPPSASDFVLFGTACRAAGYEPWQLLQQFRGWVLMQLALRGPAGLLALGSRAPRRPRARARQQQAAAGTSSSASSLAGATDAPAAAGQPQQHAHVLVSVLLFLRQVGYADPALLQQLEAASVQSPVREQLNGWQLVLLLYSFCQLGYVPEAWFSRASVACIKDLVLGTQKRPAGSSSGSSSSQSSNSSAALAAADQASSSTNSGSSSGSSLSGQDCVELLECLAAWHTHPRLGQNALLHQYILPGCVHLLLGMQHQPSPSRASGDTTPTATPSNTSASGSSAGGAGSTAAAAAAAAAAAPPQASDSTGTGPGPNLVASMPGPQVVSLLCSTVQLRLPRSNRLFQQLQQQAIRRLQQVWGEFGPAGQVAAAHAAGRSSYDLTGLLKVQELLPQQRPAQAQDARGWHFKTASAACRLLWVFGNVARHPGPQLLDAALSRVVAAATAAADAGLLLPLREVTTALYAATVLQELHHPGAVALAQLLQQAAVEGELLSHPQFPANSEHLAGCLLVAQDAAQAGTAPPPAPIASFHDADQASAAATAAAQGPGQARSVQRAGPGGSAAAAAAAARDSPWLGLPVGVQQRLQEAWRRKVLRKAGKKQGMGEHMALLLSLKQLGLRGRAKALSDDGAVCIDVAVTTPNGERLAIELLGPHNAALNTQLPLGPARLKWRMLANRGYKVVVVNAWQWRTLDSGGLGRGSRDGGSAGSGSRSSGSSVSGAESSLEEYGTVMSEKLMYLEARLQAALGPAGAAALSASVRVARRPLPQEIAVAAGRGMQLQAAAQGLPPGRRLFEAGDQVAGN